MALNLRTPGVYIVEESKFPPSVAPVETAIPAFVGYTRATQYKGESLLNRPVAVNDLLEFQEIFGAPPSIGSLVVTVDETGAATTRVIDMMGRVEDVEELRFQTKNHPSNTGPIRSRATI